MKLRRTGTIVVAALCVVLVLGAAALWFSASLQQLMFDRGARRAVAQSNLAPFADDALRVAICGSSAPLPSEGRAKACVAIFAGGKLHVVDTGPESTERLMLWGIPLERIGGVFLTHFHSDHIGDLGELQLQSWAAGRQQKLPVYGGPGVERVVTGFKMLMPRTKCTGPDTMARQSCQAGPGALSPGQSICPVPTRWSWREADR